MKKVILAVMAAITLTSCGTQYDVDMELVAGHEVVSATYQGGDELSPGDSVRVYRSGGTSIRSITTVPPFNAVILN